MPGRGRFWEKGALNDEIVEESDLVQDLQTKVNAVGGSGGHIIEDEGTPLSTQPDLNFKGGGVTVTNDSENTATVVTIPAPLGKYELLGETTLALNNQLVTVSFSAKNLSDFCEFQAIFVGTLNNQTSIGWRINGISTGYKAVALTWLSGTVTGGGLSATNSFVLPGGLGGDDVYCRLQIQGLVNLDSKIMCQCQGTSTRTGTPSVEIQAINHGYVDTTDTSITSVTMDGLSEDFNSGAKLCVYGIRK